jgi:hypothetical protein
VRPVAAIAPHHDRSGPDAKLKDTADRGEKRYQGTGRLNGRKARVTGGDSGIGATVVIANVCEGADVAFSYLAEDHEDATKVVALIGGIGRTAVALPGDIINTSVANKLVDDTVPTLRLERQRIYRRGRPNKHGCTCARVVK